MNFGFVLFPDLEELDLVGPGKWLPCGGNMPAVPKNA